MNAYKELFVRTLSALKEDIASYKNEADIWILKGEIKNTPGNLAMHLCGNLKHTIGKVLGGANYTRNRDGEFSARDISKDGILKEIDGTIDMIGPVLDRLTTTDLAKPWPEDTFGEGQTIGSILMRILYHFGYHAGQVNYHRRILD